VFRWDAFLIQRIAAHHVVVHEFARINFSTTEQLERRARANHLNDLTLALYYVRGERRAYLRSRPIAYVKPTPLLAMLASSPVQRRRKGARMAPAVAAAVSAALALAACSSNRLVTPDGKERVAVNTPDSLARYQDLVARQEEMTLEKSDLQRKYEALTRQVEALKQYIVTHDNQPTNGGAQHSRRSSQAAPRPQSMPMTPALPAGKAMQVLAPDRVLFRVNHAVGHTEFLPPQEIQEGLLRAARAARNIIIRGRTDASQADELEARIAVGRALQARAFLVKNGVDVAKIRLKYLAAGGFVADDTTDAGRALNRRVEIEASGVDVAGLTPRATQIRTGSNL
jgi:outer membrane protein OmpA-like peptidoglycan-associated protein